LTQPIPDENDGDFILKAFDLLDANAGLFKYAPSSKKEVVEIAADISIDAQLVRDAANVCQDNEWKAAMFHYEKNATGTITKHLNNATIHEVGNRVWINATSLKQGYSGGAKLYHIVSTYAYNNGKIFIGDPAGLSPIAHYRRLENMLTSAIRYKTTDHLKPHPKQIKGLNVGGWKLDGLKWESGNTAFNISSMIDLSLNYILNAAPDVMDLRCDFEQGVFYDKTNISTTHGAGTPIITETQWQEIARKRRVRTNGIGFNTLKRAVVEHTLLQAARRDSWNGVLEELTSFAGTSRLINLEEI